MEIKLGSYVKDLKADLLKMGGNVEKAIALATQTLETGKPLLLEEIFAEESKINHAHIDLDEACFKLIARQAPKARDLRIILAIIKANNDLERMGDLARNIGLGMKDIIGFGQILFKTEMIQLGEQVRLNVRKSLDAMTRIDEGLAREVLDEDAAIDKLKNDLSKKLRGAMKDDSSKVDLAIELLLIARNLERISDHATNLAEDVIFILSGEDIRHGFKAGPAKSKM